ncbi:TonB-dependent siderophore receptor [Aquabacterium sp.]|uniref:TonB-dependent siderophore receptor n=1 Tax=Aquabacterium sp. TaxID=1872578 RepID=UPI0035AFBC51
MHRPSLPRRSLRAPYLLTPLAIAALSLSLPVAAQESGDLTLPSIGVTATAKRQPKASISGLGDAPAWQQPVQALTFSQDALRDAQVTRLADVTKLDASTSDAYNTVGYWDYLTVRGFALDNAYNYRREGLPISAETRIALDNKAGIELFKGTSGIQAGVSSPGGLVNYLVKRPEGRVRTATFSIDDAGDASTSVDLGDRFGERKEWGLRINAAIEKLKSHIDATDGHRRLAAIAVDRVLVPGHVLEAEVEHSAASQPSIPGFSMLGDTLPSAKDIDPGVNLNHQPWTQPSQFRGTTGTIRLKSDLGQGWRSSVTYGAQYLKSNDRAAFPWGCYPTNSDRYCADGTFDLYDFRSDSESRLNQSLLAQIEGHVTTGTVRHEVGAAILRSTIKTDLHPGWFTPVGKGDISGQFPEMPPAASTPDYDQVDRHERTTELSMRDAMQWGPHWRAWMGLRHSQIRRQVNSNDGSFDTQVIHKTVNTPWAAIGYNVAPQTQAYVSWGEGVEIKYAPRNTANAGAPMPLLKSRQTELGVKGQVNTPHTTQQWSASVFHIARPEGATNADDVYLIDGQSKHIGIEGSWQGRAGAWGWGSSAMVLDAKRENSQFAANKSPVNVPDQLLKVSGSYTFKHPTPVTLQADLVHEGRRWVDVANTTRIPAWNRVDLSLRATQAWDARTVTWRLAVNNVFDTRAWREAPNSFDHIYLFPMAERTITASAQIDF